MARAALSARLASPDGWDCDRAILWSGVVVTRVGPPREHGTANKLHGGKVRWVCGHHLEEPRDHLPAGCGLVRFGQTLALAPTTTASGETPYGSPKRKSIARIAQNGGLYGAGSGRPSPNLGTTRPSTDDRLGHVKRTKRPGLDARERCRNERFVDTAHQGTRRVFRPDPRLEHRPHPGRVSTGMEVRTAKRHCMTCTVSERRPGMGRSVHSPLRSCPTSLP